MHYTTNCNTQSSAPEDGRDHRPKHAEQIGIINKLLLLHLVGVNVIYNRRSFGSGTVLFRKHKELKETETPSTAALEDARCAVKRLHLAGF